MAASRGAIQAAIVVALLSLFSAAPAEARDRLDIRLFARVGNPGQPEPIAIGPDGLVYVGTNQLERGDRGAPSRVFVYSPLGRLVRQYVIRGQPLAEDHGIQGLAFDGSGLLYALDRSARPRVVLLDPITGDQRTYAVFHDVPPCSASRTADCSATVTDAEAEPDYAAFGPDGSLYVTDIEQALIWRVPRGGGVAQVWFTHPDFENIFGPNGIHFQPDGRTLLLAVTATSPATGDATSGALYTLAVLPDGRPGELRQLWRSRPFDGPDGFAIARSGNVYVALAGASQIALLSPAGQELARAPASPVANMALEVPVDAPGSAAFLGQRVLVTNHSAVAGNPSSWAVLDVWAGEEGLPLFYPRVRPARPRAPAGRRRTPAIRLSVVPRRVRRGRFQRFHFRATVPVPRGSYPVAGAVISFFGRRVRTNRFGRASVRVRLGRLVRYTVVARRPGLRLGRAFVRAVR
jgi:sugar lactone lactonase YvrE